MLSAIRNNCRILFATSAGLAASLSIENHPFRSSFTAHSESKVEPLSAATWTPLKLIEKRQLTGGPRPTEFYRFELPQGHEVNFPVASCFLTRAPVGSVKEDGSKAFVLRPYTPISPPDDHKHLDLAIKVYPDGKLTSYLSTLKPGDVLDFKGPLPKIALSDVTSKASVGMVCGGTGLTPMLQVAEEMLRKGYKGKVNMIYANVSVNDIMLKDRVDALAKKYSNFEVLYVVDKVTDAEKKSWKGGVGYVTRDMLKQALPAASDSSMVLVCGPPGMMKIISGEKVSPKDQGPLTGYLKDLGYTESQVYKF